MFYFWGVKALPSLKESRPEIRGVIQDNSCTAYTHFKNLFKTFLENSRVLGAHMEQHTTRFSLNLDIKSMTFYHIRCIPKMIMAGAHTISPHRIYQHGYINVN